MKVFPDADICMEHCFGQIVEQISAKVLQTMAMEPDNFQWFDEKCISYL